VGLFALPTDHVPEGGFQLVACTAQDDAGTLEVYVEERFLGGAYVHNGNLLFNLEGYGRFRLWLEAPRLA
jgi:hypothetical protein